MKPLLVTAHLEAGLATGGVWGISLDGLVAGVIHASRKAELWAAGGDHVPLAEQDYPEDLPLPLGRCRLPSGDDWHWEATCAWAHDRHDEMPDVRHWLSRPDHRTIDDVADDVPMHLDEQAGRWRAHWMPLLVTITSAVSWRCVGDRDQLLELLSEVRAIGKKRAHGHGRVLAWEVEPDPRASAWEAGHTHPDGTLGRPCPRACLDHPNAGALEAAALGRTSRTGLRPPLTHPSRQRHLVTPAR